MAAGWLGLGQRFGSASLPTPDYGEASSPFMAGQLDHRTRSRVSQAGGKTGSALGRFGETPLMNDNYTSRA
jgi:hypothetical protein